jgi:lysophospholipase L1-like esterase
MWLKTNRWLLAVVCCVAVLLAGCGGSSGVHPPGSWQYTAMGDSLAVGILATQGYVIRYEGYLNSDAHAGVTLTNLGQNGWHSSDLLNALRTDASFRSAVSAAQVVTWDIGGDDLLHAVNLFQNGTCGGIDNQDCLRAAVAAFIPNWDAIMAEILALRDPRSTILRTMDVYDPFVAREQAAGTFTTLKSYLDQVNTHIAASAAANGIPMAAVSQAFNGPNGDQDPGMKGYIAFDGVHPNDAGHKVVADLLRGLGYAPLK